MMWVLKDGDKEIGFHYDISELLKACDTLEPEHEFKITFVFENFDDAEIDNIISCPAIEGEQT